MKHKLLIGGALGYVAATLFFAPTTPATTTPAPSTNWSPNSTNLIGAAAGAAIAHFVF